LKEFFEDQALKDHPLIILKEFLQTEINNETAKKHDDLRFIGYALEIGYDKVTIITSDPFKIAVGGIPKNSFLVMIPANYADFPPHFILLQVLDAAETPLKKEVQQTYFELHKKSMPELDIFTQSELQWGGLGTAVLGMFYPDPEKLNEIEFSHDLVNYVSAHKYKVYSPTKEILEIITNSLIPKENQFTIGKLRTTENRFPLHKKLPEVDVNVSTKDFLGTRTALFGKTRLGKSNTVKIIAQSIIETTRGGRVGQLIFDIDGEYANDNPQDDSRSLKSAYNKDCEVYSFNPRIGTDVRPLKLNFYEHPDESIRILAELIEDEQRNSVYIKAFTSSEFPAIDSIGTITDHGEQNRIRRRILMYWAILRKAGFDITEGNWNPILNINPNYRADLRNASYNLQNLTPPTNINTLTELITEFECIIRYMRSRNHDPSLLNSTGSGDSLFEQEELSLLNFLLPKGGGSGTSVIVPYRIYHDPNAGDSHDEILTLLDNGKTVILDLSNAHPSVLAYFSKKLAMTIFHHQEEKFTSNTLEKDQFIQLYFEEAHNLFPKDDNSDVPDIYKRIAKEGAKYHLGMIYSTQSITSINSDLLAQTENILIAHLSSQEQVNSLIKTSIFFENYVSDILKAKRVGYLRIMTQSHRFVIPVQIKKFSPLSEVVKK
jgi:hypothetical protein